MDSVEGLARRVARGDLLPDTPLHDASTGEWRDAGEASVVRFILDELVRDGGAPPPGWSEVASGQEDVAPPPDVPAESSDADDPLDIGLSAADLSEVAPERESGREVESEASDAPVSDPDSAPPEIEDGPERTDAPESAAAPPRGDPWGPEFGSRRASDDWITPSSAGGLFTSGPSESPADARRKRAENARRTVEESEDEPRYTGDERERGLEPSRRRSEDSPPRFEEAGRPRRSVWPLILTPLAIVVAFFAGRYLLDDWGGPGEATEPEDTVVVSEAPLVPPPGLEDAAGEAAELVTQRFQTAADSLRIARGLPSAPPGDWLSGYYLAHAEEFPESRRFWDEYGHLVEEVRLADRALFLDVVASDLLPELVDPVQRARLDSYLRARYANTLPARRELYDQLGLVSANALALHDFLLEQADVLEYTPAVGPSVPRDPVLEVGTEDPQVQRELEFHLDELFRALDRSRRGGATTLSGLRDELYGGFGEF